MDQVELKSFLANTHVAPVVNIIAALSRHEQKRNERRKETDIHMIVVHTTDWDTTPARVAKYDIGPNHISQTGCPSITYHELIMKDGRVYQTLKYTEVSWHVGKWNPQAVGVALMYRCSNTTGIDSFGPTDLALHSAVSRCGELCMEFGLAPDAVMGHRELEDTGWKIENGKRVQLKTCPGNSINMDDFRQCVAGYIQVRMQTQGFYRGPIDGNFGDTETQAAYIAYLDSRTC